MQQRVLLLGLEQETAAAIGTALQTAEFEVESLQSCDPDLLRAALADFSPNVICAPAGSAECRRILRAVGAVAPVIAVSRKPNPKEWLEALQGGAADYFGPPFERQQLSSVLRSAHSGLGMASMLSLTA